MTERGSDDQATKLRQALANLNPGDIRLDPEGRVVVTNPTIADQIKKVGGLTPELDLAARKDTNIICCGNGTCRGGEDLGAIVERFTAGRLPQ